MHSIKVYMSPGTEHATAHTPCLRRRLLRGVIWPRDTHRFPRDSCTRWMDLATAPRTTIQTPRTVEGDGAWKLEKRAREKSGRAGRVSVMLPAKRLFMQPLVSPVPRSSNLKCQAHRDRGKRWTGAGAEFRAGPGRRLPDVRSGQHVGRGRCQRTGSNERSGGLARRRAERRGNDGVGDSDVPPAECLPESRCLRRPHGGDERLSH